MAQAVLAVRTARDAVLTLTIPVEGAWVSNLGFRVWGLGGVRVWGFGFWVKGSGFRVWGLGFRVQGLGFRVWGLGFAV